MKCLRCQQENPVGAQFCGQCGAQLELLCVGCQTPNPPANRFCHRCGQPLATAPGPVSVPTAMITHNDPSIARSGHGAERRGSTVRQRPEQDELPGQGREPDDLGSAGSRAKPRRLCIVSNDRLVTGEFLQALQTSLDPDDEFEIIPDRRRANPSEAKPGAADQSSMDRRRHLYVDLALKKKGYAIVPAPVANPLTIADRLAPDIPRSPIERFPLGDSDERNDELERILQFKRRHAVGMGSWLIAMLLVGVTLVLLSQLPAVKTFFMSRPSAGALSSPTQQAPLEHIPTVAENPSPTSQALEAARPEKPEAVTPEAARPEAARPEAARPAAVRPEAVRPRQSREAARPRDASAQPKPALDPVATMPPPAAESRDVVSPRLAGLPRVDLVRNPGAASEGRVEAYVARISDAAGQPLAGAEVSLVGSMEDGTVFDIPLEPGPEPGTYRGTGPPGRSALVDLRIRVRTSDKRVEIPLRP
jgi:ribosomal protein L40E